MRYRKIVGEVPAGQVRGPVRSVVPWVSADAVVEFRYLRPEEVPPIAGMEASSDPTIERWRLHAVVTAWSVGDEAALARVTDPTTLSQFMVWLPFTQLTSLGQDQVDGRLPEELLGVRVDAGVE